MKVQLVDLKSQYKNLRSQLERAVSRVLSSGRYILDENVNGFETEMSQYLGIKHCIGVGNGTDALVIALKALGIGQGDEVITTPFTFFASAESISAVGAIPVFVDVRLDTFNIDPEKIKEKITSKTKAIMPVHIFGQPADMDKIMSIAKKHDLHVIEDACQAIGAEYKGRKAGSIGDIACFSFFPTKNLGCAGDGGMIVTDDDDIATLCRALRAHGSGADGKRAHGLLNNAVYGAAETATDIDNTVYNPLKYYNYMIGHNSRLDEIQAAVLRVKLRELDNWNDLRRRHAKFYNDHLRDTGFVTPFEQEHVKHVYHMYVLQSEKRSEVVACLNSKGIGTGIYYPVPLHLQKAYTHLGYREGDFPNAEYLAKRTFAIPVYPELSQEQRQHVIDALLALI